LASAGPSGGRLAPQGCFTHLRQCPVRRCFGHGARRGCREALAGGGFPHLHQGRIVACWHIAACHHAARGQPTLRGPGLLGCGPALPLSVITRARRRQLRRVERGLEDGGGGYWGGLVHCGPPHRRRRRIGLGRVSTTLRRQRAAAAAAGAAAPTVGGGRRDPDGGRERTEGGLRLQVRQAGKALLRRG
jgi:hypothetical protein